MNSAFVSEGVRYCKLTDRGRDVWHALQLERANGINAWSIIVVAGLISISITTKMFA